MVEYPAIKIEVAPPPMSTGRPDEHSIVSGIRRKCLIEQYNLDATACVLSQIVIYVRGQCINLQNIYVS